MMPTITGRPPDGRSSSAFASGPTPLRTEVPSSRIQQGSLSRLIGIASSSLLDHLKHVPHERRGLHCVDIPKVVSDLAMPRSDDLYGAVSRWSSRVYKCPEANL